MRIKEQETCLTLHEHDDDDDDDDDKVSYVGGKTIILKVDMSLTGVLTNIQIFWVCYCAYG